MKKLFWCVVLASLNSWGNTTYKLIWNNKTPLDLKYQLYELLPAYSSKVGTHGNILQIEQLTPVREIKNMEVTFNTNKSVILALVAKSPSNQAVDFFVAPHHTHPPSAGLDFKFNCLCYQHVYHMEKGKLWYRIMKLTNTTKSSVVQLIKLEHDVIPWSKK